MIHFLPDPADYSAAPADALARVAGLSHALAAAEGLTGGTAADVDHAAIAVWSVVTGPLPFSVSVAASAWLSPARRASASTGGATATASGSGRK